MPAASGGQGSAATATSGRIGQTWCSGSDGAGGAARSLARGEQAVRGLDRAGAGRASEAATGESRAVVLVDDLASELDEESRARFFAALAWIRCPDASITTVDPDPARRTDRAWDRHPRRSTWNRGRFRLGWYNALDCASSAGVNDVAGETYDATKHQGSQRPRCGPQATGHVHRGHRRRHRAAPHGLRGRRQLDRRGPGRLLLGYLGVTIHEDESISVEPTTGAGSRSIIHEDEGRSPPPRSS